MEQAEGKGGLVVGPAANGVAELAQPSAEVVHGPFHQRHQVRLPATSILVAQHPELLGEREDPGEPVGALEEWMRREVVGLHLERVGLEPRLEEGPASRTGSPIAEPATASDQQPVTVHGRVPVEATVEDGVDVRGTLDRAGPIEPVAHLVRELPGNGFQGERGAGPEDRLGVVARGLSQGAGPW